MNVDIDFEEWHDFIIEHDNDALNELNTLMTIWCHWNDKLKKIWIGKHWMFDTVLNYKMNKKQVCTVWHIMKMYQFTVRQLCKHRYNIRTLIHFNYGMFWFSQQQISVYYILQFIEAKPVILRVIYIYHWNL